MEGLVGDLIRFASTGKGERPAAIAYLLDWFHDLAGRRTVGMAPNPITYADIEAWSRLTDTKPTPWQVSVLVRLDDAMLAKFHEKSNGKEPVDDGPDAVKAILATLGKPSAELKARPRQQPGAPDG